jgi:hypothetical protein
MVSLAPRMWAWMSRDSIDLVIADARSAPSYVRGDRLRYVAAHGGANSGS